MNCKLCGMKITIEGDGLTRYYQPDLRDFISRKAVLEMLEEIKPIMKVVGKPYCKGGKDYLEVAIIKIRSVLGQETENEKRSEGD